VFENVYVIIVECSIVYLHIVTFSHAKAHNAFCVEQNQKLFQLMVCSYSNSCNIKSCRKLKRI